MIASDPNHQIVHRCHWPKQHGFEDSVNHVTLAPVKMTILCNSERIPASPDVAHKSLSAT